jgi:hypothetical protein
LRLERYLVFSLLIRSGLLNELLSFYASIFDKDFDAYFEIGRSFLQYLWVQRDGIMELGM